MERKTRKPNRLTNYDYSEPGAYFITICSKDRKFMFWNVGASITRPKSRAHLSQTGIIIDEKINLSTKHYPELKVDNYVIMPNHVHLLLSNFREPLGRAMLAPTTDIRVAVQQFKGAVTKQTGFPVWQTSFHDHVIRNERSYRFIYDYIDNNPYHWLEDKLYIE